MTNVKVQTTNVKAQKDLEKAREYAFLLLKYRPRSEKEVYQRLKKKKFDEPVISETLSFLKDKNFLDDDYFAKAWIESRINRPLGLKRLKLELRLKGIPGEIIDKRISGVKDGYNEEEIVLKLAEERYKKIKGIPPKAAKRRLFSYLSRRGFSSGSIISALNKL